MEKLPRGILRVEYQTSDGLVIKYRVRIRSTKKGQHDRLFATLKEAKLFATDPTAFLAAEAEEKAALAPVARDTAANRAARGFKNRYGDPLLKHLFAEYLKDQMALYEAKKGDTLNPWLLKNKLNSLKSFLNIIGKTAVEYLPPHLSLPAIAQKAPQPAAGDQIATRIPQQPLEEFNFSQVTYRQINHYIRQRAATGVKQATVLKEISILKRVLGQVPHTAVYSDLDFSKWQNPCDGYNRDLVKLCKAAGDKPRRISGDRLTTITAFLKAQKNPQALFVYELALATGMRRAEVLTLTPEQIHPNYIQLTETKTGKPRKVYLLPEAQALLKEISDQKFDPEGKRLFTLTFGNLQKIWQRMVKANPELDGVNFHRLRKEAISQAILKLTAEATNAAAVPSLFLGTFLGASNIERFEEEAIKPLVETPNHDTQAGILTSNGHGSPNVASGHYFEIAPND